MGSDWKSKASFISPNSVPGTVLGKQYDFYPISVDFVFRLKKIGAPLAKALSVLFSNHPNDTGIVTRKIDHGKDQEQIIEAINPQLAAARQKHRDDVLTDLMNAITDESSINVVYEMVMDSLRDIFGKPSDKNRPSIDEVRAEIPITALRELILGVVAANKETLGPLAGSASGLLQHFFNRVDAAAKTLAEKKPDATTGPSSKTRSSPPSESAEGDSDSET